jgi:GNAT superfamily N-acetyltransferase
VIRLGLLAEAEEIAGLFLRVRSDNLATIPASMHGLESVCGWVRDVLFAQDQVWVAEREGRLVGFMALRPPDWLDQIYLDSTVTSAGLGSRLMQVAKRELRGRIQLWTFQSNLPALRFYARHGFVPVQWTDGDNEEGQPDVRLVCDG